MIITMLACANGNFIRAVESKRSVNPLTF